MKPQPWLWATHTVFLAGGGEWSEMGMQSARVWNGGRLVVGQRNQTQAMPFAQ